MANERTQLIVVDGANVVGAKPDGWWRDRAGAARRLLSKIATLTEHPGDVVVVLEGAAKAAIASDAPESDVLRVVAADGSGDDAIVRVVAQAVEADSRRSIIVVTADRELRDRVEALGAVTVGPRWLLDRVES
ncbi:NYN domain-containing protein [Nocardia goodfellowii]|uniref:RNA-binding protein with PIN domain n=1 Tax=Nocardia goodfellowii TaxID=882446 RepID=A0ABS4QS33_9NOCA|nr:NYN domain-containing protein [Nocardia goodfellowii]MBP2194353.1 putative RNA-binding protein with PIN domain [Nocardia goodfellowii]